MMHGRPGSHWVLIAVSFLCAGSVAAQTAQPPVPLVKAGKTVKISQHVHVIPDENVPMVPNVGIVVGSKATLVIDPGMGTHSGEVVLREVSKVSRNTELFIANTHFHPEHTTGDGAFPQTAKIARATAQQQDVDEMGMAWVDNFRKRSPEIAKLLEGATFRKATQTFDKTTTLDLGGVRVRMIWLGPGHTRGDTVFYVEEDRVLFSGDLAMRNIFPAFATPQSSARSWLMALDALEKLGASRVVPAHGDLTDASVIGAYRDFITALQARVGALKRDGKSDIEAAMLATNEFTPKYSTWAQPIRIQAAARTMYKEAP
jgi:glyoxylase-like metal-dependent hydrolase (beta-lactamase superfamily II)